MCLYPHANFIEQKNLKKSIYSKQSCKSGLHILNANVEIDPVEF